MQPEASAQGLIDLPTLHVETRKNTQIRMVQELIIHIPILLKAEQPTASITS
jgi:hypothetical protein